jgi:phage terminase Nu1 subunit (DNA packaging protein)
VAGQTASNEVDTQTAAALLKVTPRWIQQLAKDGWIKPAGRGKWPLVGLVQGYIDFLKDENARKTKAAGNSELQRVRAREIELRIAKEDRSVIDLDEAIGAFEILCGEFNSIISGLPARITRNSRERQRIEAICDEERARLSKVLVKACDTARSGESFDPTGGEDDA